MDHRDICVSVFQNGIPCREEYTAKWAALINRLLKDQHAFASKGEKHEK